VSARTYYMDDASIVVPSGYRDRTAHVLEWVLDDGDKISLIVQREPLRPAAAPDPGHGGHAHAVSPDAPDAPVSPDAPVAADDALALDRYVAAQTKVYPTQFSGFHLERSEAATSASGLEMRRKVFRRRQDQDVLYHNQVFILLGADVLGLTASAKALHRQAVDRLADEALAGLRIRGEDDRR
jgi:hypothetical protein